jgi:hypothetical protein
MAFAPRIDILTPAVANTGEWGTLKGKFQGLAASFAAANLTWTLYGTSDPTYANPQATGSFTCDANGDADLAISMAAVNAGSYVMRITGTGITTTVVSCTIMVGSLGIFVNYLHELMPAFVGIERFEEPSMPNSACDTFTFGWGTWSVDSPMLAELDEGHMTAGSGFKVDYAKGALFPTPALSEGHDVRATYKFNLFSDHQLAGYMIRTLSTLNGFKPATNFTIDTIPAVWLDLLIKGGYINALDAISMKIGTFKYRRLWESPTDITSQVTSRIAEAKGEFKEMLPKIKRRGYAAPLGLSSLKVGGIPYQVDGVNWQNFILTR